MHLIDLGAQQARMRPDLDAAIAGVLDHGAYINGPEVARLEEGLAAFVGHDVVAIGCSSGTDALLLALMGRGVGPGDAVFVPGFTFPATAEAIALLGATPVFVDIEADTFALDAKRVAEAVEELPATLRPAGVLPVDLYGVPADHAAIAAVAEAAGMWVIADAAQSFGAACDGVPVGALAPVTTTSFFPAKPLGCYGDGGAVLTTDDAMVPLVRSLRTHGAGDHKYDIVRIGINGRLDTVQAAILLVKLQAFPEELTQRRAVAARYSQALASLEEVTRPHVPQGTTSTWAQYTIRVPERDEVAASLREAGIPTAVYYPRPLHQQAPYAEMWRPSAGLEVACEMATSVLSLPMHPYLTEGDQDRVVEALARAVAAP